MKGVKEKKNLQGVSLDQLVSDVRANWYKLDGTYSTITLKQNANTVQGNATGSFQHTRPTVTRGTHRETDANGRTEG